MVQLGEAIAHYHELFGEAGYRDLAWADVLQQQMREQHLVESGRLLAPVLRPQFVSRRQIELLTRAAERIAAIAARVADFAFDSPPLLSRLKLLPAEKMLAAAEAGSRPFPVLSRVDAIVENGSLSVHGWGGFTSAGLACSGQVADMFLHLPIVKEFKRGKYKLSKTGGAARLHKAVLDAWKSFGGCGRPAIAILAPTPEDVDSPITRELLAEAGPSARLIDPGEMTYEEGRLRVGDFAIDVVFRCIATRDLIVRFGLDHPLLAACRDGTVCVIDSFRAEIARRRALFELLTDEQIASRLSTADRRLIRAFVPWTRVVSRRKTTYKDQQIDLLDFISRNRETLVLRPNEDLPGLATFVGAAMTQPAWERALRVGLQTPYVVQETSARGREPFPVYQYGELQMRDVEVSVHPNLFNGRVQGASAALQVSSTVGLNLVGAAPVLLLEPLRK